MVLNEKDFARKLVTYVEDENSDDGVMHIGDSVTKFRVVISDEL